MADFDEFDGEALYCPVKRLLHSEIKARRPNWIWCSFCSLPLSSAASSVQSGQVPLSSAASSTVQSGQALASVQPLPRPASWTQHAAQNVVPQTAQESQAMRPMTSTNYVQNHAPSTQPTTSMKGALPTHIAGTGGPPSLMQATLHGRRHKQESLANLEKEQKALTRKVESGLKKVPVTMTFFHSYFQNAHFTHNGIVKSMKATTTVSKLGTTHPVLVVIGDTYQGEQALLTMLFEELKVNDGHTQGIPIEDWRICTTVDKGTKNRPPSWQAPSWNLDGPVSLCAYKDMVHDADGKEKDRRRAPWIFGGSNVNAKRMLGVFAVAESLDTESRATNAERNEPPQPCTPGTSRDANLQQQLQLPGVPLHQEPGSSTRQTPSTTFTGYGSDEDTIMVTQVPSPSLPSPRMLGLDRNPGPRLDAEQSLIAPSDVAAPSFTVRPSTTVLSRAAPPSMTSTTTPRATAPSTTPTPRADLSSIAASGLALYDATFSNPNPQPTGSQPQWVRSPSQQQDEFVRPADLEIGGGGGISDGFVEEEDVVHALVPQKRKRPSPRTVEADGRPKARKSKKGTGSKKSARDAQPRRQAMPNTRQSVRIQAKSTS